jgi:hypothetical protein
MSPTGTQAFIDHDQADDMLQLADDVSPSDIIYFGGMP